MVKLNTHLEPAQRSTPVITNPNPSLGPVGVPLDTSNARHHSGSKHHDDSSIVADDNEDVNSDEDGGEDGSEEVEENQIRIS